ncbi:fibronectin type III domain-containing protein [Paenibacillus lautus]|uniref:fibronectin type III domain-containing protein n=1 Tax=Paenibacillus lautus TaxID=1401 RepID=UPI003D2C3A78
MTNSETSPNDWDIAQPEQKVRINEEGQWYVHAKATDRAGNTTEITSKTLQLQQKPVAPVLSVVSADETTAKFEWTLPSGSALTDGYYYRLTNGQVFDIQYPDSTYIDTTLAGGQRFEYQVQAVNHVGESEWSNTVRVTISPVESATSYRIVAKNNTTQQEVFNSVVNDTFSPVISLEPGTLYDIAASAINENGEGKTVHTGFLTLPDQPGGFTHLQIGERTIDLAWNRVETAID